MYVTVGHVTVGLRVHKSSRLRSPAVKDGHLANAARLTLAQGLQVKASELAPQKE